MATTSDRLLTWTPRVLGILVGLFLGLFALDAGGGMNPIVDAVFDFAVHAIPAALVLALVAAVWRRAWMGAVGFTGLALAYAIMMSRGGRQDRHDSGRRQPDADRTSGSGVVDRERLVGIVTHLELRRAGGAW